jgi:hypothetical protein
MPQTIINPGTGRKRRQTTRFTPRKRQDNSLNAKRRKWQRHLHGGLALVLNGIFVAGLALALSYHERILENNPASAEGAMLENIMQALTEYIENSETCYHVLRILEENVADIPQDEENQVAYKRPPRFTRISSFQNCDEAKNITNFNKEELTKMIVNHSGLPVWVVVPAGGGGFNYTFHREELYLYMLIKLKDGETHVAMADKTTHGDSRRWSPGYKFIVDYLDERYFDLIGPGGMEIWANHFPEFAEAIRIKVGTDEKKFNEVLGVEEIFQEFHSFPASLEFPCLATVPNMQFVAHIRVQPVTLSEQDDAHTGIFSSEDFLGVIINGMLSRLFRTCFRME